MEGPQGKERERECKCEHLESVPSNELRNRNDIYGYVYLWVALNFELSFLMQSNKKSDFVKTSNLVLSNFHVSSGTALGTLLAVHKC